MLPGDLWINLCNDYVDVRLSLIKGVTFFKSNRATTLIGDMSSEKNQLLADR